MATTNYYKTEEAAPYYQEKNKMNLSTTFNARNIGGVYLIFKAGKLVYCGKSRHNLYKTMYRHFQNWDSSTQTRVVYKNLKQITCQVVYLNKVKDIDNLEKAIILKHKPKDNPQKYKNYLPDEKEIEIYDLVTGLKVMPIIVNEEDSPF